MVKNNPKTGVYLALVFEALYTLKVGFCIAKMLVFGVNVIQSFRLQSLSVHMQLFL